MLKVTRGMLIETKNYGGAVIRHEKLYMKLFKQAGIKHLCRHLIQVNSDVTGDPLEEVLYVFQK